MKINLINQRLETESNFGFTINQYNIENEFQFDNLLNIDGLFDVDIVPQHIINEISINDKEHGYLQGLFKTKELSVNDFRFISSDSIYYYLEGFSESNEEWGDSKILFKNLLSKFIKCTKDNIDGCYLLNKEWFSRENKKVREREFYLYDFYFVILWLDKNNNSKLYLSEWFAD